MIDAKITKRVKLYEENNSMVHNYYYLIYIKVYNSDKTKYKSLRFIIWFDATDVCEYYDKNVVSKKEVSEYLNILIDNFIYDKSYEYGDMSEFVEKCNFTIRKYNQSV